MTFFWLRVAVMLLGFSLMLLGALEWWNDDE